MLPKLNLVSVLAALVFFFLPWVSIECSGKRAATQTGFQTITGTGTPAARAQSNGVNVQGGGGASGNAYLVAFAFIGVISAAVMAIAALVCDREDLSHAVGYLCAAALACLVIQTFLGFPAKRDLNKALQPANEAMPSEASPFNELASGLAKQMVGQIEVKTAAGFYLELSALCLPTVLLIGSLASRLREVR